METKQISLAPVHAPVKLSTFLLGRCPRCGQGHLFKSDNPLAVRKMLNMNQHCSNCQLNFVPEVGFYWGATYVSYAFTVAFSAFTFVISVMLFGFMNSLNLRYVAVNGLLLFLLSPLTFRVSRAIWLWIFYGR